MTLTLHDIKVWNTGEVIDLVVPSDTDASVDASAMTIAPGFEDPHVHFRDPGQTYKESMISGCAAAASGGYTNVLIMPNTVPAMDGVKVEAGQPGASEVLDAEYDTVIDYLQHYEAAHGVKLPVRYDLCVCASKGRAGHEATEVADWIGYLPEHGDEHKDAYQLAHPVTAISDDGSAVTPSILERVFENVKESGLYLIEHCEHHDTGAVNDGPVSRKLGVPGIPEDTELKIVERDIDMSRKTGVHVHFQHVSTAISFDAIRKAKAEGLPITCETAPHYIALNDEALLKYGTLAKMNPPLRSEADRQATIAAVADGTVDLLATDHAPHTMEEKELGFLDAPNGIIGLECAYGVCHKVLVDGGFISDERLIELMSTGPAELMGHDKTDITAVLDDYADAVPGDDDTKRVLDLGRVPESDQVDLVVLNTGEEWTVDPEKFHSSARNTPFGGWQVTGRPLATIIGAVADIVPAVKPQIAMYEALGPAGIDAYSMTCEYAKQQGLYVLGDVKRGDIGSTAAAYAHHLSGVNAGEHAFDPWHEDAVTVNPYLGTDGITPFVEAATGADKDIFVLVRTSNPSSSELQELELASGEHVYEHVADLVEGWGAETIGANGYSRVGAVVGATHPEEGKALRARMPHTFFLVPGYGAQGGTAQGVAGMFDKDGMGALVNSSRGIIGAWKKSGKYSESMSADDALDLVAESAREAAKDMRDNLRAVLP